MDDDEISLKDYLNVMIKEKKLISSIFLVVVIAAAVYSFSIPNEYLSDAKLSYNPDQKISPTDAVEILKSQSIIQKTAEQEGEASPIGALSVLGNLKVENIKNTNQIQLQLRGDNPEAMDKYFEHYIKVAVEELNRKSLENSQIEYSRLENLSVLYTKQEEGINAEMKKKMAEEADFEIKRLENLSITVARFGNSDKQIDLEFKISELNSIKEGRTSSSAAQQMILSNPELALLNSQLNSINNKLVDLEAKMLELKNPDSAMVEIATPPTNPAVVGPRRNLNIAIAAVLGLFVGISAAFFKNYMEESASRPGDSSGQPV